MLLDWITQCYIDVLQALPVLVGLVWIYFGAPRYGLRLSADHCVAIVLGLSFSAFALDLLRAAERAIPKGELFAADLHGVSRRDTIVCIIAPQVIRIVADPMVGQVISVLKLSTFASIIGSREILSVANGIIAQTFRPMEVFTIVAVIFVAAVVPLNIARRNRAARVPVGDRLG
jgi:polar amino acid transport system permease protein